jgi:hypothetical protein
MGTPSGFGMRERRRFGENLRIERFIGYALNLWVGRRAAEGTNGIGG